METRTGRGRPSAPGRWRSPALVLLPALASTALVAGCGEGPPPVEVTSGSNAAVCAGIVTATRKIGAQEEQPAEIRDAAAEIREVVAPAADPVLQSVGRAFADSAVAYADAVEGQDMAAIALTRGDLERVAPTLGAQCGVSYDQLLTF